MPLAGEKTIHILFFLLLLIGIFQIVVSGLLLNDSVGGQIGGLYVGLGKNYCFYCYY